MNYEVFQQNYLMKCTVMPSRIILFLIKNHYYCLYGIILLGTNITAYIGQRYCLISPILLPNLEPSYCRMKKWNGKIFIVVQLF